MSTDLNLAEKACNFETMQHIQIVQKLLHSVIKELIDRAEKHDLSKLESPEVEAFTEYTPKLAAVTYGSDEYKATIKAIAPALAHHYARNRHHPEFHRSGIDDMNLVDLIECLADWKAASLRHHDGNIRKSIEHNVKRFEISQQLARILENTVECFNWVDG